MAFVINRADFFLCKNAVSPDGETAFCTYCFLFFFRRQVAVQTAAAVPAAKRAARPHLRTLSKRTAVFTLSRAVTGRLAETVTHPSFVSISMFVKPALVRIAESSYVL